jgi:hypothetical protein
MGLVWSMRARGTAGPAAPTPVEDLTVAITAAGPGNRRAEGGFIQTHLAPGVTRREIRERGLVGTLFTPPGPGPHPAIVMLAGSGGGIMEARAALFAAHDSERSYIALVRGAPRPPGPTCWRHHRASWWGSKAMLMPAAGEARKPAARSARTASGRVA